MNKADRAFLLRRLAEVHREWKVGDPCASYRCDALTKVARVEGAIVHLENGDSMHRTKLRGPEAVRR